MLNPIIYVEDVLLHALFLYAKAVLYCRKEYYIFCNDNKKIMLELVCKVYNINKGNNKSLLDSCRWLSDYMVFVDKVREYHTDHGGEEFHNDIEKAMETFDIPESEYDKYLSML